MKIRMTRDPDELATLAARVDHLLRRHFEVEESELYPTLLEVVDDWEDRAVLLGSHEDHRIIVRLLDELEDTSTSDERFHGKVHALDKMWQHHYREEEERLHEMARDYLDQAAYLRLSKRIRDAERARGLQGVPDGVVPEGTASGTGRSR